MKRKQIQDLGFDPDKIYYHGTISDRDFDEFKHANGDIGFHFGTISQAEERLRDKMSSPHARILTVHLRLKNPLRMRDLSHFSTESIRYELENHPDVYSSPKKLKELDAVKTDSDMRNFIKSMGHDGIIYRNEKEVPEARPHINKANEHLGNFKKQTGLNPYRLSQSDKEHPEYKAYQKESQRAEQMVNHFAQDSVIVFDPNQIRKTTANYDPSKSHSGNINESTRSFMSILESVLKNA